MIIATPSELILKDWEPYYEDLCKVLSYKDKGIEYQIKRLKNDPRYVNWWGEEKYQEQLNELKSSLTKVLLWRKGEDLVTYTGLFPEVLKIHPDEVTFGYWLPKPNNPGYWDLVSKLLKDPQFNLKGGG